MYEYHAGTGALTWALLVLTDGTLSTHVDIAKDRIRYSECFHAVLRVPAWGTLDARMNNRSTGMGPCTSLAWDPNRVLCLLTSGTKRTHTSALLVLTQGAVNARMGLAGRSQVGRAIVRSGSEA